VTPFVEKQQEVSVEGTSEKKKKTKWVRMNLPQAVWACIVKELLSFGVTVNDLAVLAENVWQKPREQKYADAVFKAHLKRKNGLLAESSRQKLENALNDELLMENEHRTAINPFTDVLKSAVDRPDLPHSMLFVPETIEHGFLMHDTSLMLKLGSTFLEHPLICIPMVPMISKVLAVDFGDPKKELSYLSELERQIRDIVVFKKPKIVEIAFEGDHIKPIVVTEEHKSKEQLARYILENRIAKGSKLLIDIRSQGNYKLTLIKK
jgi:hypothetical protein